MNCASRLAASALLLAVALPLAAQVRQTEELPDPWLVRAQAVSNDLNADAPSLLVHDRALLWARLGLLKALLEKRRAEPRTEGRRKKR